MSPARRRLVATRLPLLRLEPGPWLGRPAMLFDPPKRAIWMEIGFGAGEHLAQVAARHPDIGFIGCEPYLNGVASLLARIEAGRLDNIRIWNEDSRPLLESLGPACLERVIVLFPDPWPKRRHAARRLIAPATLDQLARIMADGALLRLASDDRGYIRWALSALLRHPDFLWEAERADDWRLRPADQPETRYEAKARAKGIAPVFLTLRRRPRDAG